MKLLIERLSKLNTLVSLVVFSSYLVKVHLRLLEASIEFVGWVGGCGGVVG